MYSKFTLILGCCCLLAFADQTSATDKNGDKNVPKLYEEIGCTEVSGSRSSGLTRFDCPDFKTYDTNKCHYGGKTFNVGDDIEGDFLPSCRAGCKCLKNGETAEIVCANVECPEHFGGRDWSCVSTYDNLHQCCRTGEICDRAKIAQLHKCEMEGQSYRVGERIYPDGECYECLCTANFNNKTSIADNSNCKKIDCGIQLKMDKLRAGCVPVYFETPNCCPIDTKCPEPRDEIDSSYKGDDKGSCKHGDLTLQHGQRLKTEKCMKCECEVPPYLTCIKIKDC